MEIKTYVGTDGDPEVTVPVLVEGRRHEEKKRVLHLDDGSVQEVHESLEEVVPMRVAQRVTRKMVVVPVEEKVEKFSTDGTVDTKVRTLPAARLSMDAPLTQEEQLNSILEAISSMKAPAYHASTVAPAKKSFWNQAVTKYGKKSAVADVPTTPVPTPVPADPSVVEVQSGGAALLTSLAWAGLAVASGVFAWVILGLG